MPGRGPENCYFLLRMSKREMSWQEPKGAGTSYRHNTKLPSGLETVSISSGSVSAISQD